MTKRVIDGHLMAAGRPQVEFDRLVDQFTHQQLFEQDPEEEVDHRLVEQQPLHLAEQEPLLAPLLSLVHKSNTEVNTFFLMKIFC